MRLLHRPAALAAAFLLSVATIGALPLAPASAATSPSPGTLPVQTAPGTPHSEHLFTSPVGEAPKGSVAPRTTSPLAGGELRDRAGTIQVTLAMVQLADTATPLNTTTDLTAARASIGAANDYWRTVSNNRISLAVAATRTGVVSTARSTDYFATIMNAVAKQLNWSPGPYKALVIYVPVAQFAGGALGYGMSNNGTGGQVLMPRPSAFSNNVVAHEFGHTLGLMHADALQCGSGASDVGVTSTGAYTDSSCYIREYGDTTDLMGAAQQNKLPTISSSFWDYGDFGRGDEILNAGVATGSKTYTLTAWAGTAPNRAVKFTDPRSGEVYYLELRLPVGNDAATAIGGNRGVKIVQLGGATAASSLILMPDTRPFGDFSYNTAHAWQAGRTFTTHAGTRVTINAIGTTSATVTVTAPVTTPTAPPTTAPPTAAPTTPPTTAPTTPVTSPTTPIATPTSTPIATVLAAAAATQGLGAATAAPVTGLRNGGLYQTFERGNVVYSPATGAHVSRGPIWDTWLRVGAQNTVLGYPTADEVGGLKNGGTSQTYQGGTIVWSPASGAQVSKGAIRSTWLRMGAQNGVLGYPTTGEIGGLKNGGMYQTYQGATIVWSPASGAQVSKGAIRGTWLSLGAQNGRLGYPKTGEYRNAAGALQQDFQGGRITWTSATGTRVSY